MILKVTYINKCMKETNKTEKTMSIRTTKRRVHKSLETQQQIYNDYFDGSNTIKSILEKYSISRSNLYQVIGRMEKHNEIKNTKV